MNIRLFNDILEPPALHDLMAKNTTITDAIQISQAISLKRIADALELFVNETVEITDND